MKNIFILLTILTFSKFAIGQEFIFPLYFEDALGYKDTLLFGYDSNATDTIDLSFGEINIISTPLASVFECRIADRYFSSHDQYISDPTTFHTKKQIKKKDCVSNNFPLVSVIYLSRVTYPLKVFWESSLFIDTCRQQSLITDWHPGGWFDAVHGGEQGPFYLNSLDTVTFTHTTQHYITTTMDTIDVLYITIASANNFIESIQDIESKNNISIFPNPTNNVLTIQLTNPNLKIKTIQLYDLLGSEHHINWSGNLVDLEEISSGLYFIRLTLENGNIITRKIIRE